jgi:outer membrane beta-barrel protein
MYKLLLVTIFSQLLIAGEDSVYKFNWLDNDEEIFIIQNKEYIKSGRVSIDGVLINNESSPYQDTLGFAASLSYYFNEEWSIDYTYKSYSNTESKDYTNLVSAYDSSVKPLVSKVESAQILHINWVPFYGKLNTFNKIIFFDWGVGLGAGTFQTASNWQTFDDPTVALTFESASDSGFNFKTFFRFHLTEHMSFGIQYDVSRIETIRNPAGTKDTLTFSELAFFLGYIF